MKVAFLNLCHCDPRIVARVTNRLTANSHFDMYIHVDAKQDIKPFEKLLKDNKQAFFVQNRHKVYWGGYNAITATYELLSCAIRGAQEYDYFVLLQNLDYPIKSNAYIEQFFEQNQGLEFIRACKIGHAKDWHFARKYKIFNKRDDSFYLNQNSKAKKLLHKALLAVCSIKTIGFGGIIKEDKERYPIFYGAAQWAVTRECAKYILNFEKKHPKFNRIMSHIQFPDEEYFHTIVHNSKFKEHCSKQEEPQRRWLVNWRNLHYYEYPKEVTVFEKKDFDKLMQREELFIRKVRTEKSDELLNLIDGVTVDQVN